MFVRNPNLFELKDMQDSLGGRGVDVLEVPAFWSAAPPEGRPLYKEERIKKGSPEWNDCIKLFEAQDPKIGKRAPNINIEGIIRVENLTLWQSHAAKWASMLARQKDQTDKEFHGKSDSDLEKEFV